MGGGLVYKRYFKCPIKTKSKHCLQVSLSGILTKSSSLHDGIHLLPAPFPGPQPEAWPRDEDEVFRIKMGEVGPRKRGFIDAVGSRTRTSSREHIKLLTMDPGAYADHSEGFRRAFMQQTCAKERGLIF